MPSKIATTCAQSSEAVSESVESREIEVSGPVSAGFIEAESTLVSTTTSSTSSTCSTTTILEIEVDKADSKCTNCWGRGRVKTTFRGKVPEGLGINFGKNCNIKGAISIMQLCGCVMKKAQKIAKYQLKLPDDTKFKVKLKENK